MSNFWIPGLAMLALLMLLIVTLIKKKVFFAVAIVFLSFLPKLIWATANPKKTVGIIFVLFFSGVCIFVQAIKDNFFDKFK